MDCQLIEIRPPADIANGSSLLWSPELVDCQAEPL